MSLMRTLLPATALLGALTGCASEGTLSTDGGSPSPSPQPLISTTAELSIVSPAPGAVFRPAEVPVELALEGGEILEEASTDVQPDTGHIHVELDGKTITLLAGLEFDLAELNGEPLTPGTHLLQVEFVAADHRVFSPREQETLTFTVKRR